MYTSRTLIIDSKFHNLEENFFILNIATYANKVKKLKNVISELSVDIKNYGIQLVLRKLLLSLVSVQLAQNIGVDHHAATEELYYYMKKKRH